MTTPRSNAGVVPALAPALPAAILVIFFISGTSALIDQIVWTRALYRIFGVTSLAASTVLAAFMAGLALGSYLFGRLIDRGGSSLKMYAVMELAIAVITPLTPWTFRALQPVYSSMAGAVGLDSPWLPILRGLLCFAVLLPPTMLMGGTLPVLAKAYLRNQPGRITASLYSINTWGAVFGCFLAGFVLLGTFGETRSLLLASLGNLIAAIWAWTVARRPAAAPYTNPMATTAVHATPMSWTMYIVFIASFINGFAALALEVLWGRTLGLLTDASVYAYTGIIGMFLAGIALGSRLAGPFADRVRSPMLWLGVLVWSMGIVLVVALRVFVDAVPHEYLGGESGGTSFPNIWLPLRVMLLAAAAVAPLTVLSGACFPFLVRLVVTSDGREGRQLGSVYSINTIGGIIGAVVAGFALLPLLADQGAFCVIALVYVASGALCLAAAKRYATAAVIGIVLAAMAVVLLPFGGSLSRGLASAYGRIHKHIESASGTVTAFTQESVPPPFPKRLLVNGTAMTVLCTDTKIMAHLPLMLHPRPDSALVVCFGMGTTFRSAAVHDLPVTVVELQPSIPSLFEFFHPDAPAIMSNPKNQIKIGDGRNFLLLSNARYSVITIDPAPPMYSAGTVNLYTQEFFTLCRDHLDDNGIMSLWIPGYSCMESDFRLILKTFTTVFPEYALWIGPDEFGWYLVGSRQPIIVRPDRLSAIASDERIRRDLTEYHLLPDRMVTAQILLNEYMRFLSGKSGINRYVADERRILTDDRPYTEFPMLEWIRHGESLKDQWFNLQKSIDQLAEPPPGRSQ